MGLFFYAIPAFSFVEFTQPRSSFYLSKARNSISFKNNCSSPIRVAIHYLSPAGQWRTKAWYSFKPGELARLNNIESKNRYFYYYAEVTDGTGISWQGKDLSKKVGDKSYNMRKIDIGPKIVNWTQALSCPKSSEKSLEEINSKILLLESEVQAAKRALKPDGMFLVPMELSVECALTADLVLSQYKQISLYKKKFKEKPYPRPAVGNNCEKDKALSRQQERLRALYKERDRNLR